jgi:phosphoglycolate phosphatase
MASLDIRRYNSFIKARTQPVQSTSLVVFDWNGTLLADTSACVWAADRLIRACGGKRLTLSRFRDLFDIPLSSMYLANGCDPRLILQRKSTRVSQFYREYEQRSAKCRSRRGAREFFMWLKRQNIPIVILSNHSAESIGRHLKRLELREFITEVLTNEEPASVLHQRRKGARLAAFLKRRQVPRHRTVIIGDSLEEVHIGQELVLTTIALSGGACSEARLRAADPDYLVHSLSEAHQILRNRWRR